MAQLSTSWRPVLLLLLAGQPGCSDYGLFGKGDTSNGSGRSRGQDADQSAGEGEETPDEETPEPAAEVCNGRDDDGDGDVDEGFPDTDGDGQADCVDDACTAAHAPAGVVDVDDTCLAPDLEVPDPFDLVVEWQHTTAPFGPIVMPTVGQLTDDNHDGRVDGSDVPDVAVVLQGAGELVILDGATGTEHVRLPGYDQWGGLAIADVDGDGRPELLAATADDHVVALDGDGSRVWTSAESFESTWQYYPQPTVADLDGDGNVEVIFDKVILDGATGATVATVGSESTSEHAIPAVGDLDGDGVMEVLFMGKAYAPDGTLLWSATDFRGTLFAALLDLDGDPGGEVVFVGGRELIYVDDDGTVLRTVALNDSAVTPGAPAVADFDGDGAVEIAVPGELELELFELDGSRAWSAPILDDSGVAAASGFDFDADGAFEVVYADEDSLTIFDGATGAPLFTHAGHASGTLWEYPVIADVDGDGAAELVVSSSGPDWNGVTVLGHAGGQWPPAGPTWPTHDFSVVNVGPEGQVPTGGLAPWSVHNVYRARPATDTGAVNLGVAVVDLCVASCAADGAVELTAQVWSDGPVAAPGPVEVAVYAVDGTGHTELDRTSLAGPLGPGERPASLGFSLRRSDFGPDGLVVVVDPDNRLAECWEDDGTSAVVVDPCG